MFMFGGLYPWSETVYSNTFNFVDINNQNVLTLTNVVDAIGLHGPVNVDSNLTVAGNLTVVSNLSAANLGSAAGSNGLQFLGAVGGKGSNNVLTTPQAPTNLTEEQNLTVLGATSLGNGNMKIEMLWVISPMRAWRASGQFYGDGRPEHFHPRAERDGKAGHQPRVPLGHRCAVGAVGKQRLSI